MRARRQSAQSRPPGEAQIAHRSGKSTSSARTHRRYGRANDDFVPNSCQIGDAAGGLVRNWRAAGGGHDQAGRPHSRVVQA